VNREFDSNETEEKRVSSPREKGHQPRHAPHGKAETEAGAVIGDPAGKSVREDVGGVKAPPASERRVGRSGSREIGRENRGKANLNGHRSIWGEADNRRPFC
jgi:hypothetical protein